MVKGRLKGRIGHIYSLKKPGDVSGCKSKVKNKVVKVE